MQEVKWDRDDTESVGEYKIFYGKGNQNHELGTGSFVIRESYQQLKE
jgi:hypothetical protein